MEMLDVMYTKAKDTPPPTTTTTTDLEREIWNIICMTLIKSNLRQTRDLNLVTAETSCENKDRLNESLD